MANSGNFRVATFARHLREVYSSDIPEDFFYGKPSNPNGAGTHADPYMKKVRNQTALTLKQWEENTPQNYMAARPNFKDIQSGAAQNQLGYKIGNANSKLNIDQFTHEQSVSNYKRKHATLPNEKIADQVFGIRNPAGHCMQDFIGQKFIGSESNLFSSNKNPEVQSKSVEINPKSALIEQIFMQKPSNDKNLQADMQYVNPRTQTTNI
jgi:hypothetical protein